MSGAPFYRNVINLGNSIIGVSILAMPYCFKKCGILLCVLMILLSGLVTRAACHLLLKSAIVARRRNFEFLAFHTYGHPGKLIVEVGIIGFLIGVSIAFFVVIGDLGPPMAADFFVIQNTPSLRAELLLILGIFVAFPLGLLRKLESLTSFSAISIGFYAFLVLKIFSEALPHLASGRWWAEVYWWQPQGLLTALPIVSLALSCQTQLFEFFDTMNEPSLKRMNSVVNGAINLCSIVYISVGFFGYVAFYDQPISGNILVKFPQSFITDLFKLGFITTVVISFPLCLFPCRTSLHSLLFKQNVVHYEITSNYIPDHRFRSLTIGLVTVTILTAIVVPNIEFVLGMIGSTIGTTICFILPSMIFIHLTNKQTNERRVAQMILCLGIFILVACTYTTLNEANKPVIPSTANPINAKIIEQQQESNLAKLAAINTPGPQLPKAPSPDVPPDNPKEKLLKQEPVAVTELFVPKPTILPVKKSNELEEPLHPDALKKEDKEMKPIDKQQEEKLDKQDALLKKLEAQQEEQKKILEEQKKVLQELKDHKDSHVPIEQKPNVPADNEVIESSSKGAPSSINAKDEGLLKKKDVQPAKINVPNSDSVTNMAVDSNQEPVKKQNPIKLDSPVVGRDLDPAIAERQPDLSSQNKTNRTKKVVPQQQQVKAPQPQLNKAQEQVIPMKPDNNSIIFNKGQRKKPAKSSQANLERSPEAAIPANGPQSNLEIRPKPAIPENGPQANQGSHPEAAMPAISPEVLIQKSPEVIPAQKPEAIPAINSEAFPQKNIEPLVNQNANLNIDLESNRLDSNNSPSVQIDQIDDGQNQANKTPLPDQEKRNEMRRRLLVTK